MFKESVFKSNQQGVCPFCDSDGLKYEKERFDGENLYFKWVCTDCDKQGSEWYMIDFLGHTVINKKGEEQEVGEIR